MGKEENILSKSENATLLLMVKMTEKAVFFPNFFCCKIKCLTSDNTCAEHMFRASGRKKKMKFHV